MDCRVDCEYKDDCLIDGCRIRLHIDETNKYIIDVIEKLIDENINNQDNYYISVELIDGVMPNAEN